MVRLLSHSWATGAADYLVSRFRRSRTYQRTYLAGLRKHFGTKIFDTLIDDWALFEKSVTDRFPVTLRAPQSPAAQIARDFLNEVLRRIGTRSQSIKRPRSNARAPVGASTR